MTEEQYIEWIQGQWPREREEEPSEDVLRLAEKAVRAYPRSPRLLCMLGDLVLLSNPGSDPVRRQAMTCYERALGVDPGYVEALDSLGYCHDILDDLAEAERMFRRAIQAGGSPDSFSGLARVLQQQGRTAAALEILSPARCPCHDHPVVAGRRREIESGDWDAI